MATQMEEKLKKAGVKVPSIMERIWRYVKDKPDSRAQDIAIRLKMQKDSVSSLCGQMVNRGMFVAKKGPYGPTKRMYMFYSVAPGMDEFEIIPHSKADRDRHSAQAYFRNHGKLPEGFKGPLYIHPGKVKELQAAAATLMNREPEPVKFLPEQPPAAPPMTPGPTAPPAAAGVPNSFLPVESAALVTTQKMLEDTRAKAAAILDPVNVSDEDLVAYVQSLPVLRAKRIYETLKEIFE